MFERKSLAYAGSFQGDVVSNTDGIFVPERSFGPFKEGALYAVHNDGNTVAIDWTDIADGLDLSRCRAE